MKRKRVYANKAKSTTKPYKKGKTNIIKDVGAKSMLQRPLNQVMGMKFHYYDTNVLNPTAVGGNLNYIYRLSSIFDPDFTGVGHQPLGHDQVSQLFERYQVWKVDFIITFVNRDGTNNQRVGYRISDAGTGTTNVDTNWENGMSEVTLIGRGGGHDKAVFRGSVLLNDVHGISYKQYMGNDDYGAPFGQNPQEEGYLFVCADGLGIDTGEIDFTIKLVYHTKVMGSVLTTGS